MNLFYRSFISYLSAFLVILLIMTLFLFLGYQNSITRWKIVTAEALEEQIRKLLREPASVTAANLPGEISVFIYNSDKQLILSNRGAGRRRQAVAENLKPVYADKILLGYYDMGALEFHASSANQAFLFSMQNALLSTLIFSLIAAFVSAWLFARSVANPARSILKALEALSAGNLDTPLKESGPAELHSIAHSANILRSQLLLEHELRRQWVQDIVHDLRTPVTALNTQFDAIIDGLLPPSLERISRLKAELGRITHLIDAFVELMNLEAPDFKLQTVNVNIHSFFQALHERFLYQLEKRGMKLQIDVAQDTMQVDERLLFRALSNVIDNAIKYASQGSTIFIDAGIDKDWLNICVKNSGTAIAASEQEKIFERLYRADYGRSADGSGLGLTIAQKIVNLHGGKITVTSNPGELTVFCFILPTKH